MKKAEELLVEPYITYKKFIDECRNKKYDSDLVLHKHHIIPKNLGGTDEELNLILVSVEDHIKLHLLLADCFEENTQECVDNLRSARVLNSKSIRDKKTLMRISRSYEGEKNPFHGKKHKPEVVEKLKESSRKRKGCSYEKIYGNRSEEERNKRKDAAKKQWEKVSDKDITLIREKISKKLRESGSQKGSKNGFAKKVKVNGIVFGSISEACEYYQTNKYKIRKYYTLEIIKDEDNKV
jgi:hypothetical protein